MIVKKMLQGFKFYLKNSVPVKAIELKSDTFVEDIQDTWFGSEGSWLVEEDGELFIVTAGDFESMYTEVNGRKKTKPRKKVVDLDLQWAEMVESLKANPVQMTKANLVLKALDKCKCISIETDTKDTKIFVGRMIKTYPGLEVEKEIHKADMWVDANKKYKSNYKKFLTNWMNRKS